MALLDLVNGLNIDPEIIKAFQEEKVPENASELIKKVNDSKLAYLKATPEYKKELEDLRTSTFSGSIKKAIRDINKKLDLGLKNSELDEFTKLDEFLAKVKEIKKEEIEKLTGNVEETLKADLNKYKISSSEYKQKLDALEEQISGIKSEYENKFTKEVSHFKAKEKYRKLINSHEELKGLDVPGKDFILETIEEKLFSNYDLSEDLKIIGKDGTKVIHPEKDIVIEDINDILPYYFKRAGLVNRGNGGVKKQYDADGKLIVIDVQDETEEERALRKEIGK